jgi:chromosome segregation ATPase
VSLAEKLVEELEADEKTRKRLVKLLVPEAVSEPELRLAIINAVLRDVATKSDVAKVMEEIEKIRREDIRRLEERIDALRKEMYTQITELRERVSKLEGAFTQLVDRISDLDKRIDALDKRIDSLDKRIDALDRRIDSLDKRIDYVTKVSWALTLSVLATLAAQVLMRMFMP